METPGVHTTSAVFALLAEISSASMMIEATIHSILAVFAESPVRDKLLDALRGSREVCILFVDWAVVISMNHLQTPRVIISLSKLRNSWTS